MTTRTRAIPTTTVPARLDELRLLKDGWLEGKGLAPSQQGLDWLSQSFDHYFPDDLPLPYIYPTAEGTIQVEWALKPNEVTLEIDLSTHASQWHSLNLETDEESSHELNLADVDGWRWLVGQVRGITGGAA